jgi:hypothetical protein
MEDKLRNRRNEDKQERLENRRIEAQDNMFMTGG